MGVSLVRADRVTDGDPLDGRIKRQHVIITGKSDVLVFSRVVETTDGGLYFSAYRRQGYEVIGDNGHGRWPAPVLITAWDYDRAVLELRALERDYWTGEQGTTIGLL